jgi:hypothetical protein
VSGIAQSSSSHQFYYNTRPSQIKYCESCGWNFRVPRAAVEYLEKGKATEVNIEDEK